MRFARMPNPEGPVQEQVEHLSADLLWAAVKRGQPLPEAAVQHAKDCRDCREFVWEFSTEADFAGFRFPALLPQSDQSRSGAGRKK
jgi:hypothetical protein